MLGVLVIYPVDVCDSLLITLSGFLTHASVSFVVMRFIRSDVQCHLAAYGYPAAALALKASVEFAFFIPGHPAGAFADPAEGDLGRSCYFAFHAAPSSFLGSTKKVSSCVTVMPQSIITSRRVTPGLSGSPGLAICASRSAKSLSLAISSVVRI